MDTSTPLNGEFAGDRLRSAPGHKRRGVLGAAAGMAAGATVAFMAPIASAETTSGEPPVCAPRDPNGPVWVTPDCTDPGFAAPIIDAEEDLAEPVPHRKVSGHFEGADLKFNIYLPPKTLWEGRFFHKVYPLREYMDENASDDTIAFGSASGAFTVQTNATSGYRGNAAAAKFAKTVAAEYYGEPDRRIYGYLYGGSGGSFQTVAGIEHSTGVWDGAVPFIIGAPTAVPHTFFVRAFARLVLEHRAERIGDAVAPGGGGDPRAGLEGMERMVFDEVTAMGVPLRCWEDYTYLLGLEAPDGLLGFGRVVRSIDPGYADDFWTVPGYLGTEESALGDWVRAAKVEHTAVIESVEHDEDGNPSAFTLDAVPAAERLFTLEFTVLTAGTEIGSLVGTLDRESKTFTVGEGNSTEVLLAIQTGGQLRMDNRWTVALTSFHRHQVPSRDGFDAWDQFRDENGDPIYPQRPVEIGPMISKNVSGGGTFSGAVTGKVIVVANLLDVDAYPWHGDWYAEQVRASTGADLEDGFRIWFNDHADHQEGRVEGGKAARLVDFNPSIQQALRDLAAWVEQGREPPSSTDYRVSGGQFEVPPSAADRGGIQPVVELTARGAESIEIAVGDEVRFKASIQAPPGTGEIVAAEWDFNGDGEFSAAAVVDPQETVKVKDCFTFDEPGVYFPVLRATLQRQGDANTPFARVQNLGRMRVTVR